MFQDLDLRAEVISAICGQKVKPSDTETCKTRANVLSFDEFHLHQCLRNLQPHVGYLEDEKEILDPPQHYSSYLSDSAGCGKYFGIVQGHLKKVEIELFIDEKDFFDPQYDYDFTQLSDSAECMRGGEPYKRPIGWYRMALKVKDKYPDGNTWLGSKGWRSHSVAGEWPVSYHGTSSDGAKGIINSQYMAGDGAVYGRGIYSTPVLAESENYAKIFQSKKTGKSYKVILQNRINPERREVCRRSDYWLIPVVAGTSASEEKEIVEGAIRPYGILIQEMK
ncbi:hypothetical protein CesoFtcFv8_020196 [Champsocephalus esox]|uniref:PARP catalytic domain-containing protein n=1 Tax=Champsocephalus esox TaxID=159716 RepID=A0AAN8BFZ0_9TELE|nr:hypothetical protein CesoFtcFv8_020196 [Champsocephalus esox]